LQIHINKFGRLPKNVIFGLDAWIFNKNNGQTRYLSLNDEYLQFRKKLNTKKEFNQKIKSNFFYLLSIEYAKENKASKNK
jgi:hypothetical protein